MIHKALSTLILVLIYSTSSNANTAACDLNGVISFKTKNLIYFEDETLDYCLIPNGKVPAKIQKVLVQLGKLSDQVAHVFGLDKRDVFPQGIKITLTGQDWGDLDSTTSGNEMHLGVFSDWNGETIDASSFAHEATHAIISTENKTPASFKQIGHFGIAREALPDFIAYLVTGKFYAPILYGVPPSVRKVARDMSSGITYDSSVSYFQSEYIYARINSICLASENRGRLNKHTLGLCSALRQAASVKRFPMAIQLSADAQFSDAACNDPQISPDGCDSHQMGIPVNEFLRDLNELNKGVAGPLFIKAFEVADIDNTSQVEYSCFVRREMDRLPPVVSRIYSYEKVFSIFKSSLSAMEQSAFDKLWRKYGMDKLIISTKASQANIAKYNVFDFHYLDQVLKPHDPCEPDLLYNRRVSNPSLEECRVLCQ